MEKSTEFNNYTIYKKFKFKAQKHIYYLEIVMCFFMFVLYEFKFVDRFQSVIIIFIMLFNIAFVQNMLNNLVLENPKKNVN